MVWAAATLTCSLLLLGLTGAAVADEPRFVPYSGPFAYGLEMLPPWKDGGKLVINFPEHLERWPDTQGILRHNDPEPKGHWVVSEDGRSAVLDVDSATMAGVHVKGVARVASPNRVELSMRIDNHSGQAMPGIRPLYCVHYRYLTGFPQWHANFEHTYALMDGAVASLASIPTASPDADVKGAYVRGCTQRDSDEFPASRGGLIAKEIDRAIVAVTALHGKRAIVLAWTPGKTLLSNAAIPCAHADPYYGPIAQGQSVARKGLFVFTEQPVEQAIAALAKEGWGAPPDGQDTP